LPLRAVTTAGVSLRRVRRGRRRRAGARAFRRNLAFALVLNGVMSYVAAVKAFWWRVTAAGAAGASLLGALAETALPPDSPFQVIVDRNPFALKPPPTNAPVAPTAPPPVQVNVNLSGIAYDRGVKRVYLVIPAGQAGRTNTTSFSLTEDSPETEGIKVEEIDVQAGLVRILKGGTPATLDFKTQGLAYKGPVNVAVLGGAKPGVRPGVPVPVPNPGAVPQPGQPVVMPAPGAANPGVNPMVIQPQASATASPALRTIPSRSLRTPAQAAEVDPALQLIQLRAQQLQHQNQGIPFPPIPPVPGLESQE
jgi:hypothetical protein